MACPINVFDAVEFPGLEYDTDQTLIDDRRGPAALCNYCFPA
jgi:hypothetical protein